MFQNILLAFIPIFVAVDVIGILPIYVSLTRDMAPNQTKKLVGTSVMVAGILSVGFVILGKTIFKFLGITIGDFMVAGGAILFAIAILDLINPDKRRRLPADEMGVVPLGTPLIAGPAVLTTSLIMLDVYGAAATLIALVLNIILVGLVLLSSNVLIRMIGQTGARALSKIIAVLLAAFAVMMIRKGILLILAM